MNFVDILKSYLEVGLLGLSGSVIIYLAYITIKRNNSKEIKDSNSKDKRIDKKDSALEKRFDSILELLQQQNQIYQDQQIKNTETLINGIVNGILNHVPSTEENKKLTKVSEEIDKHLQDILIETGASRACLIQYHNGGRGINKQSFLKMSMTNEQVQLGITPMIKDFKDIFRSTLAYFVKELDEKGFCYINDYKTLKDKDISMYEFLSSRGVQAKYGLAIRDKDKNIVVGFVCIEFMNKDKVNLAKIEKVFKDKQVVMETLLSL